ncbi:conserved hypothetical protein [Trichinella spiralis]|uniref:hypothetical protein n=1 Tax=Trichinella spiralis TaxID=6334 RepID=UPI0001EFC3F9|nr:conserved hypothetical protein [Trichinella spiralis]
MLLTSILSVALISQLCHCILQANVPMLGNPYEKLRHNEVYLTIARYQNPLTNEHIIPGLSITYLHEDSDFPVMECKSDECRGCLQIYLDDYIDQQVNEKLVLDALLTLEYMNLEQDYRHFCENKQKPWTITAYVTDLLGREALEQKQKIYQTSFRNYL